MELMFWVDIRFHARDVFTPVTSKLAAELIGIWWALQCLQDLHIENLELWSELSSAVEAINNPIKWPLYRSLLDHIHSLLNGFHSHKVLLALPKANSIARDIAKSVTRDGRLRSYLSIGGPAWLHHRIPEESWG
ncbi:putative protein phosphatase 2C-like protein 45 [Cardamine amara subsp. amara]|uniref:RNase H type-1 domain-containing protein n=1 Tax=Cardamine amara subsp. amara TaxID=228776 RepID=A0ABD1BMD6_CARAN